MPQAAQRFLVGPGFNSTSPQFNNSETKKTAKSMRNLAEEQFSFKITPY